MKTVVVIGSNSFSGADFVDLLLGETAYNVVGVSRSPEKGPLFLAYRSRADLSRYKFIQADLNHDMDRLLKTLGELKPAYIVNFAAQSEVAPSWKNPDHWFLTNAVAITRLANFLKDQPWLERYVHISSPEVYGTCEGVVKEDGPLNPSTPYAASKAAGDLSLFTYVKNFKFPMSMIRATNVYGPRQQLFKIIPRSAIYLKLGKVIELHGGGHAVKSYIHIRDVSRGELAAMERGRTGEIYHLSPDGGVAVRDAVKMMCEALGKTFEAGTKIVAERLGQDKAYVIDSTKARTEFGWRPKISLREGINEVAQWVDKNWDAVKQAPLDYIHKP
ncbi:MAG: GDP-mannose 4,6-dehydratase [Planctomycetota bacterium]|nr:GDP-mannose 4,6-dehydratase [Planctomycetota bacterium]